MMNVYYIISGVCFLTLIWLLWLEYRRRDRSFRIARMIATSLAVAALAGILLPIAYAGRKDPSTGSEGVLLTEGYNADSVQAWLKDHPQQKTATPETFASLGNPSTLHLFGYGLTQDQWAAISPASLALHLSPPPTGILTADWQRRLLPGQPLQIQGAVAIPHTATAPRSVKLLLTGLGATLDSFLANTSRPTDRQSFQLSTIPAPLGPALYHLLLLDGKDTLEREDIPVEVHPGKTLNILMLAASPGWENSFLQKWMSKEGQGVAVRTAVSRDKFDKAFVNLPQSPLEHLSTSELDRFDIIIAEASVLSSFSAAEQSAMRREIAGRGLGLIIRIDSAGKSGPGTGGPETIEVHTTNDSARAPFIVYRPGLQPLYLDSVNRILVAASLYGRGKMIFTTRNSTWSEVLAGDGRTYAAYWSELLRTASSEKEMEESWQMQPDLPAIGEPVHARLQSFRSPRSPSLSRLALSLAPTSFASLPGPPQLQGHFGVQSVALQQDALLPFFWQGTYWPPTTGWQSACTAQGDTTRWYVWPADAWQSFHRQQRWNETRQYIASRHSLIDRRHLASPDSLTPQPVLASRRDLAVAIPVPKGIFFVIFTLCIAFLWAERKMEWMSGRKVR
ncbi:MAG TPA: hypothetical protein VNU72_06520 [Puia sp.]|nr:hypothetical protein [Puia sp.]